MNSDKIGCISILLLAITLLAIKTSKPRYDLAVFLESMAIVGFIGVVLYGSVNEDYVYQAYTPTADEEGETEEEWLNDMVTPRYYQGGYPAGSGIGWTDYPVA